MKLTEIEIQETLERYDAYLTAAYVRGALMGKRMLSQELEEMPLEVLTDVELAEIALTGENAGLSLYHFKRKEPLPRVSSVLGFLSGIQPQTLLDVGSGRGAFLFPFLNQFPDTAVTSVDLLPRRVQMLDLVHQGGVERLTALQQDICTWEKMEKSFDVVTLLEVLEHIPDVQQAVKAAVKLARRYVVVSVPSKPDDNPEHIHLLTKDILTELFGNAGCSKLHFGGVNGHLIMTAVVEA